MPTLADALFVLLLLRVLQLGATDLFNDPGTGWHLRTGHQIVATGSVPTIDAYSYTRAAQPWVETQWLADVLMALAHAVGGYTLLALISAVLLAGLFRWIYRTQVEAGGWPTIALLITFAAAGAAAMHFLARPLLASSIGVPLCFWWASQYARARIAAWKLWLLVPMAAVWCNLHPGVLGGIATVGLCGFGVLATSLWPMVSRKRPGEWQRGVRLIVVASAMGAATLANPYGVHWHVWVVQLMGSQALPEYVEEWRPLAWHEPAALLGGLLVAVALVATVLRRKRTTGAEALVILFWIFQGFSSARHMPLTAMIVALQLGRILPDLRTHRPLLLRIGRRLPLFSDQIRQTEARTSGGLASLGCVALLAGLSAIGLRLPVLGLGVAGPSPQRFSPGAVAFLRTHAPPGPVFNDLSYGGTLIRDLPGLPVFADDRFGLYGEDFVVQYCRAVFEPEHNAARLLDRWRIRTVLTAAKLPLCTWLDRQPEWTRVFHDQAAAIHVRQPTATEPAPHAF
ncbi:MAG TPA: hypothetical protein VM243_01500 [Phycisphaerae bacterium]|nr:hypothetical protein [Phycisphaerae bacterium]